MTKYQQEQFDKELQDCLDDRRDLLNELAPHKLAIYDLLIRAEKEECTELHMCLSLVLNDINLDNFPIPDDEIVVRKVPILQAMMTYAPVIKSLNEQLYGAANDDAIIIPPAVKAVLLAITSYVLTDLGNYHELARNSPNN